MRAEVNEQVAPKRADCDNLVNPRREPPRPEICIWSATGQRPRQPSGAQLRPGARFITQNKPRSLRNKAPALTLSSPLFTNSLAPRNQ